MSLQTQNNTNESEEMKMKLIDLLKVMDKNDLIFLNISVCGMRFETRHSAGFCINKGIDFHDKKINKVYSADGGLCVKLGD